MTMHASAAEILEAGVTIEPEEAVAIAQQLIAAISSGACASLAEAPFGPPEPGRVILCDDGSVTCRGCDATPAVSEMARLVDALLPPPPARVPGGLRYTIARALLDVDVAPFDSLDELSEALARYERGPRELIVQRVLERCAATRGLVPVSVVERRRHARATELRRALREADARLYLQRTTLQAVAVTPRPKPANGISAAIAGVAAGALLMAGGEYVWQRDLSTPGRAAPAPAVSDRDPRSPDTVALPAPQVSAPGAQPVNRAATYTPIRDDSSAAMPSRVVRPQTAAPHHAPPARGAATSRRPAAAAAKTPAAKRTSHPIPRVYPEPTQSRGGKDGMLERFRLRWLKDVFTKADL